MYILLLYGFIYLFFYCANQLEDLFSKCQLGFILFFFSFFLSSNISVVVFSIGNQRIFLPSLELEALLPNRRTAGKTGLKGWVLSVFCSED